MIHRLPSLPQVLLHILDAIHSDQADFQHIADIIRQDAAITIRLLEIANSSFYGRGKSCTTIERALLFLGTETVKTIVITAATKQFFNQFQPADPLFLQRFWRRSLVTANFAQVLATLTSYSSPDEAYLCGLLTDVGQLILLTEHADNYQQLIDQNLNDKALINAELSQLATTHCDAAAYLVDSWAIDGFMSDALRYHHQDSQSIQDAHQLVKIINLASQISIEGGIDDRTLQSSYVLFGLNQSLTQELRDRVNKDVANMAQTFGVDLEQPSQSNHQKAHQQLGQRLGELNQLAHLSSSFSHATTESCLDTSIRRAAFMSLGVEQSLLFTPHNEQLSAHLDPSSTEADFSIGLELGRSIICDAFLSAKPQLASHESVLSIIDQQLLRHFKANHLYCLPLSSEQQPLAVLVCGLSDTQWRELEPRQTIANAFAQQAAKSLLHQHPLASNADTQEAVDDKIREAVHEASNPLSIIRNYLEALTINLGSEHAANQDIGIIKEEIDRVGDILLRLRDSEPDKQTETAASDLNALIEEISQIFRQSICLTHNITINLQLDSQLKTLHFNSAHIKQIITNLVKNACEALSENGIITISTEASVSLSGVNYAAITIEDNGPGIALEVKQQLFSPIDSTKGDDHAGLGLSIVNKLVKDMNGSIVCRSNTQGSTGETGTQFQILLPK